MQNEEINKIEDEIKTYDLGIKFNPNKGISYYKKGEALVREYSQTKNSSQLSEALECYDKCIELEPKSQLYLAERSKLHVEMGNPELAVEDIRKIKELQSSNHSSQNDSPVIAMYVSNTVRDIAKLDEIQAAIPELVASGKIDQDFAKIFVDLTKITEGIAVTVGVHDTKLKEQGDELGEHRSRLSHIENQLQIILKQIQEGSRASQNVSIQDLIQEAKDLLNRIASNEREVHELWENLEDLEQRLSPTDPVVRTSMLTKVVYDNKLLNYPDLLKDATQIFSIDKILTLSVNLSSELVEEAIKVTSSDIILAGLISVDCQ